MFYVMQMNNKSYNLTKVISMDLYCQILYEAGKFFLKMNCWEYFEKTQF